MRYLTFDQIKQQLRLSDLQAEEEQEMLTLYADAAEETVLQHINRTLKNLVATYDGVPRAVKHATLLLVAQGYQHREPSSAQNLAAVPYAFDMLLKPYIRLTGTMDDDGDILTDVYGDPILDANGKPIPLKPLDHEGTAADVRLSMTAEEVRRLLEGRDKNGIIDTVPEVMDAMGGIDDDTHLSLFGRDDAADMMNRLLGTTPHYDPYTRSVYFAGVQPEYDPLTRSVSRVPEEIIHIIQTT